MKNDKGISKGIVMVSQIGVTMLTPILLCVYVGYQLDKRLSTSYWFIIFLVLGFLTAFRNVFYMTKQFYAKDKEKEDRELEYIEGLKREGRMKAQTHSDKTDK